MNLLTFDFGNTRAHAALFRQGELKEAGELKDVEGWLAKHQLTFGDVSGVISQVKSYDEEMEPLLKQGLLCERIKDYWRGDKFAGMPVNYAKTLGEDRLIQAYGVFKKFQTPTLVIDAGSFLTVDVVTNEGFQGGYILPGLKLLRTTLTSGAQLQEPSFKGIEPKLLTGEMLPHTTPEALEAGMLAYAALIQRLLVRWGITQVLISGGDASLVQAALKPLARELPLQLEPHLVHWSLFEWYRRNISG